MKYKILIADDDEFIREFFDAVLSRDYDVELYSSGQSVEDRIKEGFGGAKLIILDQVMDPGLRGFDLIKKYSSNALLNGCRMILHTAEGKELGEKAVRCGAFTYMEKPMINIAEIERIVRSAVEE